MISSGIETATFRLVAQCLNRLPIWKNKIVALTEMELNFDEFKKESVATWNWETSQYSREDRKKPSWPVAGPSHVY
jgi:hypothetical protein